MFGYEVKTSSTLGKPGQGQSRWKSQYQLIAEFSVSLNGGNFAGKAYLDFNLAKEGTGYFSRGKRKRVTSVLKKLYHKLKLLQRKE